MFNKLFLLALLVSYVYCRTVTFSIISFGTKKPTLVIGNKKWNINRVNSAEPLYRGKLSSAPDGDFEYHYIVDGVAEEFTRVCTSSMTKTHIDFYGRKDTIKKLETFKYPDNNWNRSIGKTSLFDDSYIPTIHFSGNVTENFFKAPTRTSQRLERFTFYLKDEVFSYSNVPVTAKNRDFSKFQIRFSLGQKNALHGRYLLKFRNGSEDPINLRQFIYGNIIQALGIPSIHSNMVRVYYNMKPVGFYTLQEEAFSDSFLRSEFYGNPEDETINPPATLGYGLDCSTGSDFEYKPYNLSYYDPFVVKSGESIQPLLSFCKALDELDTNNLDAVQKFNDNWFDIDSFYKAMAMEYLTGDWDGYWYTSSNFAFYNDPTQTNGDATRFYFITQDHDETFGVGLHEPINTVGYDFPKLSYTTMLNKIWHYDEYDAFHRTLVDKFIGSNPTLQKNFQDTLIKVVQNIFNPVSFSHVVDSYYERYRPEVEWDYSFERPYKVANQPTNWNLESFDTNLKSEVYGLPWGLYEWVTLRAEALKKEFCITWEGDENPPDSSCVPYVPTGSNSSTIVSSTTEVPTTTSAAEVTTTTEIVVETTIISTAFETEHSTVTVTKTSVLPTTIEPTFTTAPTTTTTTTTTTTPGRVLPTIRHRFLEWLKGLRENVRQTINSTHKRQIREVVRKRRMV